MNGYKNMDLKVDLILLNQDTVQDFIDKYRGNIKSLMQRLVIIVYLDDFMYIDGRFKEKLIIIKELLKKNNIEFDEKTFESYNVELEKRTEDKSPRGKTAILDYYNDLNKFISNNDIEFDRLTDIYETIKIMDSIYIYKKKNDKNSSKVILFLTDIKYKIELFNIKNKLQALMNCKCINIESEKVKKITDSSVKI